MLTLALLGELREHRDRMRRKILRRAEQRRGGFTRALHRLMRAASPRSHRALARVAASDIVEGMDMFQRCVEDEHDAFLICPGMGPMTYITAEGRILVDDRTWDGDSLREAADDEATVALVAGAKFTQIAGLLALLPAAPPGATSCTRCEGKRWAVYFPGSSSEMVCFTCAGRGWLAGS